MTRFRPARPRAVLALLVAVALVAALTAMFLGRNDTGRSGCAEMADAVGLYPGNDVTMRGVRIGEVTSIAPSQGHVEVRFDLDDDLAFPADVSAVTTSDSIVTDRHLEIPTGHTGGPAWDMSRCIPLARTHTPKSVSEAYAAFDKLSREVTAAAARSGRQRDIVADAMNQVNDALRGTGPDFNAAIAGLAAALGDPALRDGQLRSLLTNVGELTGFFVQRWPALQLGLTKLGDFAVTFDEWFSVLNPAVVDTTKLTPSLLRLIRTYSPDVFRVLDALVPLLDHIPVDTIVGILRTIRRWLRVCSASSRRRRGGVGCRWRRRGCGSPRHRARPSAHRSTRRCRERASPSPAAPTRSTSRWCNWCWPAQPGEDGE